MKILFLTINRETRVAKHFDNFQKELAKVADVDFIRCSTQSLIAGQYCRLLLDGKIKQETLPYINDLYDFVVTDAPFAYVGIDWSKITIPRIVIFEDMHGPMVKKQFDLVLKYGAEIILHRYKNFESFHEKVVNWGSQKYC